MMKRLTSLLLLFSLFLLGSNITNVHGQKTFIMDNIDIEYKTFDGTTGVERLVNMKYHDDTYRKQRIHFLEPNQEDDIHLITVSDYNNFGWGMTTLEGMIYSFETKNPHLEVLAGINGDFYDINGTGHPIATYVEDYEVIKGSPTRNVFNIRANNTYEITVPQKDGREILVIDENNEIKFREKIDRFNKTVVNEDRLGVFLPGYDDTPVSSDLNPVVVDAFDIKYTGTTFESARGYANLSKEVTDTIKENEFIVVGKNIHEYITETDRIIVQQKLIGYEDVRGTIGGVEVLVEDGKIGKAVDGLSGFLQRAPRTSVGIRKDGSVFFVVTEGRTEAIPGTTLEEDGYIMLEYGAVSALRLDGGGSSSMVVKQEDGTFKALNELSDGRMRSISNAILVVRGDINEQPVHIKGEDTRIDFSVPKNLHVDYDNNVNFDFVDGATRYIITIGDKQYETSKNSFSLDTFKPGDYEISVRTKGNFVGKSSLNSDSINYKVKEKTTQEILHWLINFSKNNN